MKNGGGPACLRLRVVLSDAERAAVTQGVWMNDTLVRAGSIRGSKSIIATGSRPPILRIRNCSSNRAAALDELTQILGLGALYDFQR